MASPKDVLQTARSQVGTVERLTNKTKYGAAYGLDGYPWCAMFVTWCFKHNGMTEIRYASCDAGMAAFKSGKWGEWIPASRKGQPGDIVFYGSPTDSTHTGILVEDRGSIIVTIEGNTSSSNAGSQVNGGGVYRRERPKNSWVIGFGRPRYVVKKPTPDFTITAVKIIEEVVPKSKVAETIQSFKDRGFLVKKELIGR